MTCSGVFIVNFKHISHLFLMIPLLTLKKRMLAGKFSQHFLKHFKARQRKFELAVVLVEADINRCSTKWTLKISQNSQKNTCTVVSFISVVQPRNSGTSVSLSIMGMASLVFIIPVTPTSRQLTATNALCMLNY